MSPPGRRIRRESGSSNSPGEPGGPEGDGAVPTAAAKTDRSRPDHPSDADAIRRARAGDHDAFRMLVERYQGRAFRLALRVLRNEEPARDAVQEAFIKAYASLARFEGRSSFYTWLYRLVVNQCLDFKRRERADRHVEWDGDSAEVAAALPSPEVQGVAFGPAAEVMRKELRREVAKAIEQLPANARDTLMLREVDGLRYAEIARLLGIPKGTVMSRLHYARKRVQQILLEAGVVEDGEEL